MRIKALTPQQKWNRKHEGTLRKDSNKYYHTHRTQVLKRMKIRYRKNKHKNV